MTQPPNTDSVGAPMMPASRTPARMPAIAALVPVVHALLRVVAGLLFWEHGLQKLFGLMGGIGGVPGATVQLASQMGVAGVFEFAGGILLIIGLWTRPVALILLAEMLVAFFTAHFPRGGFPIQNGGELALLYAILFAFLIANGAGPFSIDAHLYARQRA